MTQFSAETVTLDAARADAVEPEVAGRLLHATDPHIFGFHHGHDEDLAARHLGHQWCAGAGLFSHRFATGAYAGDRLVGFELGYGRETQEANVGAFVGQAQAFLDDPQFAQLARWFEYGPFVIPPTPGDAYYLSNLAALPEARGRGIGEKLLLNAFEKARAAGHARVQLDVYEGNPAFRLYERVGMRTVVETRVPPLEAEGIGLHLRMELRL